MRRFVTESVSCLASGLGLLFLGMKDFSFNASHYTPEDLAAANHPFELRRREETIVHVDAMMSGMGSNSCGPELLPQYRLSMRDITFRFRIVPCRTGRVAPFDIARSRIVD
jgi:beta-galactosidase